MGKLLTCYDMKKYLTPIWHGDTVLCETVLVFENALGEVRPARLAYPAKKILGVTSFNLKRVYEEGKDYTVTQYGELQVVKGGDIPILKWDKLRLKSFVDDGHQLASADAEGAYLTGELFRDHDGMSAWMITVSYLHEPDCVYDVVPDKSERLALLTEKLIKGEQINVVSYGDSITYGWGASGMHEVEKPPFCPPYNLMVLQYLQSCFGVKINHVNPSVSGKCTDWAELPENIKSVTDANPDFVILAFGMNDAGGIHPEDFYVKMKSIIEQIREKSPNAEFVIVSPIMPNPLVAFTAGSSIALYHAEYYRIFERLERNIPGVAYANVTKLHKLLLERKNMGDTLSNNVNHPNDFMHRVYAQTVLKTILGVRFEI